MHNLKVLTITSQGCSSQLMRPKELLFHVTFKIYEHTGQVSIREVGDASLSHSLQEFCVWKLGCQLSHVLVDESTLLDSEKITIKKCINIRNV